MRPGSKAFSPHKVLKRGRGQDIEKEKLKKLHLGFWKCYVYIDKELTRNCDDGGFRESDSKSASELCQEWGSSLNNGKPQGEGWAVWEQWCG